MKICRSISSLTKRVSEIKKQGKTVGLVPTMGFLHQGHKSLRKARKDTDCVIVSIFVNPTQFCPKEDFKKYPRDLEKDYMLCERQGVDIVFAPGIKEMYPENYATYVNVEGVTDILCGASRPGHFRGVTTVVSKLFNIAMPDIAYFGQKDSQQAIVIKKMAQDLNMRVKIKVMPIVREKDGLAMSSRNIYLGKEQRFQAQLIYRSLEAARHLFNLGEKDSKAIVRKMTQVINEQPAIKIDYLKIVNPENLKDVKIISKKALAVIAVKIGKTRLIDNIMLNPKRGDYHDA